MSEPLPAATVAAPRLGDRLWPAAAYTLYFLGLCNGLTILIGLIIAYANRYSPDPGVRSHYEFLIRTFWIGLGAALLGAALVAVGAVLSIILIGIPILFVGGALLSLLAVWYVVRLIVGAIYLARDEAYPRPTAWLL